MKNLFLILVLALANVTIVALAGGQSTSKLRILSNQRCVGSNCISCESECGVKTDSHGNCAPQCKLKIECP